MKRILMLLFVMAFLLRAFPQEYQYVPFPKTGALWSEIYYSFDEDDDEKTVYECFAVNGEDTIINNLTYTKVYHFYDSVFDKAKATCVGGIREDSLKRVYYIGEKVHSYKPTQPNQEIILFDFGVEQGDTIYCPINSNAPRGSIFLVSKIDTIELGGTLRKRILFNHDYDFFWGFSWIEGMGSTRGLLFVSGTIPMSVNNHLICFFQNNEPVYHYDEYDDCFGDYVGIDELELKDLITVTPNPVINKELIVNFNTKHFDSIQVFSPDGSLVGSYPVKSAESITIQLPHLAPGIYYYKALTKNGTFSSGRFILQE